MLCSFTKSGNVSNSVTATGNFRVYFQHRYLTPELLRPANVASEQIEQLMRVASQRVYAPVLVRCADGIITSC